MARYQTQDPKKATIARIKRMEHVLKHVPDDGTCYIKIKKIINQLKSELEAMH